jgi:hypothetical protein
VTLGAIVGIGESRFGAVRSIRRPDLWSILMVYRASSGLQPTFAMSVRFAIK